MLHKSFRFFWVAVVLCAGCAHKAATYQKATGLSEGESGQASSAYYAPVAHLRMSGAGGGGGAVLAAPRLAGLVEAEAQFLPRRDSWPCGTSWKSSRQAPG